MQDELDFIALKKFRSRELEQGRGSKELWDHLFRETEYRPSKGDADKLMPFIRGLADIIIKVGRIEDVLGAMIKGEEIAPDALVAPVIIPKPLIDLDFQRKRLAEIRRKKQEARPQKPAAPVPTVAERPEGYKNTQRAKLEAIRQAKRDARNGIVPKPVAPEPVAAPVVDEKPSTIAPKPSDAPEASQPAKTVEVVLGDDVVEDIAPESPQVASSPEAVEVVVPKSNIPANRPIVSTTKKRGRPAGSKNKTKSAKTPKKG